VRGYEESYLRHQKEGVGTKNCLSDGKRAHRGGLCVQADSCLATARLRQQLAITASIKQQKENELTVVIMLPAVEK
jgi:hypothetical protein